MNRCSDRHGFTLIEIAIVLIIIGILLGIGVALMGPLTKQAQFKRSRERVRACKEAIIGFVAASGELPTQAEFQNICNEKDAWGRSLVYIPDDSTVLYDGNNDRVDLTSISTCCASIPSDMAVNDMAHTGGTNNYKTEVAFIVLSTGENRTQNGSLQTGQSVNGTTYALYTINEYSNNYDDIVEYVTIYELRNTIKCEPLQIVTVTLPEAIEDSSYSANLKATGGCEPYTWNNSDCAGTASTLPPNLTISGSSIIGTPNMYNGPAGTLDNCSVTSSPFSIRVTDATGSCDNTTYTLTVRPQSLRILTSSLPDASINLPYNSNIIGNGGNINSYSFNITGLPTGLSYTTTDCNSDGFNECAQITGTPSGTCGDYQINVLLSDTCSSTSKTLSTHLYNPLSCTLTGTDNGDGTWTLNWTITGEGTINTINGLFSPQSGTCTNISTTTGSCITGTLTTDTTFTLRASDGCGDTVQCQYTALAGGGGGTGYTLTILKTGTGTGTVTSTDGLINCGPDCTETYPAPTSVTLNATADPGSTFIGWGGDCIACGSSLSCTIAVTTAKTCSAQFDTSGGGATDPCTGAHLDTSCDPSNPPTIGSQGTPGDTYPANKLNADNKNLYLSILCETGVCTGHTFDSFTLTCGGGPCVGVPNFRGIHYSIEEPIYSGNWIIQDAKAYDARRDCGRRGCPLPITTKTALNDRDAPITFTANQRLAVELKFQDPLPPGVYTFTLTFFEGNTPFEYTFTVSVP